jgi:hypothetical protein
MASRFLRSAVRTVTISGTVSVGGTTDTVLSIYPDGTLRFVDGNGVTQVVHLPARYTTADQNGIQPNSEIVKDGSAADQLYALFDALDRRA